MHQMESLITNCKYNMVRYIHYNTTESLLMLHILQTNSFDMCVCVCGGGGGRADGRALVMTSRILYSAMKVEGSILVEATLLQFP